MIGHSLGADTTLWVMPLEERIQAAVISGGGLMGLPGDPPHGLPFRELLTVIAPRPFFEVVGNEDYLNICDKSLILSSVDERMAAKRAVYKSAEEIYAELGGQGRLGKFEFDGGHCFPDHARKAAYTWFKQWL